MGERNSLGSWEKSSSFKIHWQAGHELLRLGLYHPEVGVVCHPEPLTTGLHWAHRQLLQPRAVLPILLGLPLGGDVTSWLPAPGAKLLMMSLFLSISFVSVPPKCNGIRGDIVSIIMMIKVTIVNIHIVLTMSCAKNCSKHLTFYSVYPIQALGGRYYYAIYHIN